MRCRHCNRPLEEIEPGLYDECERCGNEGMWQYNCDVEIVEDDTEVENE